MLYVVPTKTTEITGEELEKLFKQYPGLKQYLTPSWRVYRDKHGVYLNDGETDIIPELFIAISKQNDQMKGR